MTDAERRKYDREQVVHILLFEDAGACYFSGKVLDISPRGMRISSHYIPEQLEQKDAELTFQIGNRVTISNSVLKLKCTVRWIKYENECCEFGVKFEEELNMLDWEESCSDEKAHYLNIYT